MNSLLARNLSVCCSAMRSTKALDIFAERVAAELCFRCICPCSVYASLVQAFYPFCAA